MKFEIRCRWSCQILKKEFAKTNDRIVLVTNTPNFIFQVLEHLSNSSNGQELMVKS